MQKVLALLAFLMIPFATLQAQDAPTEKVNANATPPPIVKAARDYLMINFLYDNWIKKPDSIKVKAFSYSFHASLCYDFPIKKTNLSFAAGLGINTSVVYLNQQVMRNTDSATYLAGSVRFMPNDSGYKKYKFVTSYIMAPFELRYFGNTNNRNNCFKAAIGLEIGTLLGGHTKAATSVDGTKVNYKIDTKRYITPWNFAATARIGYGNFTLYGSYNLTNVFKDNAGPPITPMSVGLCISGL